MKKLSRLKLTECDEVMTNHEMKNIVGGSSKQDACSGKALCASCTWSYEGTTYNGKCSQNAFGGGRYCSDLNCHY